MYMMCVCVCMNGVGVFTRVQVCVFIRTVRVGNPYIMYIISDDHFTHTRILSQIEDKYLT